MLSHSPSRRRFLRTAIAGSLSLTALSWSRVLGANDKLRVASVGVSGKGWEDHTMISASPHVRIVALCDVDEGPDHLGRAATRYPAAQRFTDYRRLLDQPRDFD